MIECFKNTRQTGALVHNITNYVTAQICADIQYAVGARGIMADELSEVEEICASCNCLNLNIGTINSKTLESMILAGKCANSLNLPVVFDPVGVCASNFRGSACKKIIEEVALTCICGNYSEIKFLAGINTQADGVDTNTCDIINHESLQEACNLAKNLANKLKTIIAITAPIDIITNGEQTYCVYNGVPEMGKIVGSGCQASALIAAYLASNKNHIKAVACGIINMGLAGEIAKSKSSND